MSDFTDRAQAWAERAYQKQRFSDEDYLAYREVFVDGAEWAASQEPTDVEVEAALVALLVSEDIASGATADEAAERAIREAETRDLTNLRTGVRAALTAAREARA